MYSSTHEVLYHLQHEKTDAKPQHKNMDDLDFTTSARDAIYDPAIARTCFETLGEACKLSAEGVFFAESERSEHMYLLLEGDVRLFRRKRVLDIVHAGEVFGEIAAITGLPRTAWAVALTPCKALRLNRAQFQEAIGKTPEFALMLMGFMINRIRLTVALLSRSGKLRTRPNANKSQVFSNDLLKELAAVLGNRQPQEFPAKTIVMREGDPGGFMYVVLSGRIAVLVKDTMVDRVEGGGMIGEMALVDRSPRAASAIAETDAKLLALNRDDFLKLVKSNPRFAVSLLGAVAIRLTLLNAAGG